MRQKWYKSYIAKAVLIIMAHIMIVVSVASFLWIVAYPTLREELFEGKAAGEYSDTRSFSEMMLGYSDMVLSGIRAKEIFETEGKYNPDKLIDIEELYNTGEPGGNEKASYETDEFLDAERGHLIYRLGDLVEWSKNRSDEAQEQIVVCKRSDGTFHYYKMDEFYKLLSSRELQFIASSEENGQSAEEILAGLEYTYDASGQVFRGIQDSNGVILYSDCWIYDGNRIPEIYLPAGEAGILDLVNQNPEWNGRLNEAYVMLQYALDRIGTWYVDYENSDNGLEEGNSNFSYICADMENGRIYTNKKAYENFADLEKNRKKLCSIGKYAVVTPLLADFDTNMDINASEWKGYVEKSFGLRKGAFLFAAAVDTDYPVRDDFYTENELYKQYGGNAAGIAVLCITSGILFLVCVLWLSVIAGRNHKDEELHLNWFDHWKTEIAAGIVILLWIFPMLFIGTAVNSGMDYMFERTAGGGIVSSSYVVNSIPYIIGYSGLAAFTCCMFLIGLLSLVRRIKAGTVWKNSILKCLCEFVTVVFRNLNSVWKVIVCFGAFGFVQLLFVWNSMHRTYSLVFLMLLADLAAFGWMIYKSVGKMHIKKGLEKIRGGEVEYKIPLEGLYGDQKVIAGEINLIGGGLDKALEKSMKSERLKTDLITNVSHDIKTPLTSIINYVELLKQENFEDPKIRRYIEVLEQKSQRLKTLTEDVVEASKVSSGNITLEYMDINLVEMIQQSSGEFEEKFKKRNLEEVLTLPEEGAFIHADGRRTWRIVENLYNNAAKYAMEGTRVYVDLIAGKEKIVFTIKNISEQPLNISADELTERFIRGDISRSTEGSGLGLSIAKTLTEMQGGTFELYLDGDLFKATICFPRVRT